MLLASLLGARTLLGAPGIATRSKDATRNKCIRTGGDVMRGDLSCGAVSSLLGWRPSLVGGCRVIVVFYRGDLLCEMCSCDRSKDATSCVVACSGEAFVRHPAILRER